jgi:hypothetical protein
MSTIQTFLLSSLVICGLIGVLLLSVEFGYRMGTRRRLLNAESAPNVQPTIEASVFGLMGILIGFTFYGAASRFDIRRSLAVREANAIGTTYLRLDLLPAESKPELQEDFRAYLRSRLEVERKIPDMEAVKAALDRSSVLQDKLWKKAVEAARDTGPAEKSLVLNALNETIDITTDRTVALITHPPGAVYVMLVLTVITSSALAGYTMAASAVRDWMSIITLAVVLGIAIYVIVDYEYPRIGFVRIDYVDQVLESTLEKMK